MRPVSIVGVGMTRFGKLTERTAADLGQEALLAAVDDSGVPWREIEAVYSGSVYTGMLTGQRIVRDIGLSGVPVYNLENACSSSATALREAWVAVSSGLHDVVVVVGVETLTKFGGGTLPLADEDHEVRQGMTMPALYAMRAQRYLHEYGVSAAEIAAVVVKNRANGRLNPRAMFQKPCSLEEVMGSRPVADPFTLFHCCASADGAAAAVVCADSVASRFSGKPVRILGSSLTSGRFVNGFRDMTTPEITVRCAHKAYEMAGVGPEDLGVVEVHDAFSIAEILYYEALGLCRKGEGARLVAEGATSITGRIPVNPSGGLIAKGHPIGATGLGQVAEVVWQLRGEAGPRQTEAPRVGLTHCTGGGIAGYDHGACTIHILAV